MKRIRFVLIIAQKHGCRKRGDMLVTNMKTHPKTQHSLSRTMRLFASQWRHQLMVIPAMISFLIFSYIPSVRL